MVTIKDVKLLDILRSRRIFKLVLGLGNQSEGQIRECVRIYAASGCDMFDVNASEEAIRALYEGIKEAGKEPDDFLLCISVGIEGDIHTQKAIVDKEKCVGCEKCRLLCPQNAISIIKGCAVIDEKKCIGCRRCKCFAITYKSKSSNFREAVELAKKYKADCIELHVSTKSSPLEVIRYIVENTDCVFSLCVDRKYYSNEDIRELIEEVIKINKSSKFIIQADGVPMSGGDDSLGSTLQAVAMAHLVERFGTFIFISGGTNSKTASLADECGINFHGVSVGSYARKIIRESSQPEMAAKKLVSSVKKI